MTSCPIGLDCSLLSNAEDRICCNHNYCKYHARSWAVPYTFESDDHRGFLAVVCMPSIPDEDPDPDEDDALLLNEFQSHRQECIRIVNFYHECGWALPIQLPYFYDDISKALTVWAGDPSLGFWCAIEIHVPMIPWRHNMTFDAFGFWDNWPLRWGDWWYFDPNVDQYRHLNIGFNFVGDPLNRKIVVTYHSDDLD